MPDDIVLIPLKGEILKPGPDGTYVHERWVLYWMCAHAEPRPVYNPGEVVLCGNCWDAREAGARLISGSGDTITDMA